MEYPSECASSIFFPVASFRSIFNYAGIEDDSL